MNKYHLLGGLGVLSGVLLTMGCGGVGAPGTEEQVGQTSEAVVAAPALSPAAAAAEKGGRARTLLSAASYSGWATGNTFRQALFPTYLQGVNSSVTVQTNNPSPSNADTVCVLFRRCDNSTTFVSSPWGDKICTDTMGVKDDDYRADPNARMSTVSYTVKSGDAYTSPNAWVMCFAYCWGSGSDCRTGSVDVTVSGTKSDGSSIAPVTNHVSISSGILPVSSTEGYAYLDGRSSPTPDPVIFVFTQNPGQPDDGGWNDDAPSYCPKSGLGTAPCYPGLTNHGVWLGADTIGRFTTGTGTMHW